MSRRSALPAALLALAVAAPLVVLSGVLPALAVQGPLPAVAASSSSDVAARTVEALRQERVQRTRDTAFAQAQAQVAEADRAEAARVAAEQAAALAAREAEVERASRSRRALEDPRGVARELLAARGQGDQFSCLDRLWTKESEWKVDADNPTSSAYGIPQALPGKKMASAGADWRTNPETQIRWGLGYIAEVYGGPCAAWRHSQARNWY